MASCAVNGFTQDFSSTAVDLVGYSDLPANTFSDGPPSGAFDKKGHRTEPRFDSQPLQGFSSLLKTENGTFLALSDNGFGVKKNSVDYLLRIYRLNPKFRTASGGKGVIRVDDSFIQLSDPNMNVPFQIVNENTDRRRLTGADFDVESMVRMPDGSFWIGEEFGPFLLHVNADGELIEEPVETPHPEREDKSVRSPDNPYLVYPQPGDYSKANLPRSRGFEGMARRESDGMVYPILEGAIKQDPDPQVRLFEFDPSDRSYTGRTWRYELSDPGYSIGEIRHFNGPNFLIIERDNKRGKNATFKKIFLVNLERVASSGALIKKPVVDLLDINDSNNLSGYGSDYSFPFWTIESIVIENPRTIYVTNDNNFPSEGIRPGNDRTHTELIRLKLPKPISKF